MGVIWVILGIAIGFVAALLGMLRLSVGTLNVDQSDPYDGPLLFLELSKPVNFVRSKKYVLVRVTNKNYISQK